MNKFYILKRASKESLIAITIFELAKPDEILFSSEATTIEDYLLLLAKLHLTLPSTGICRDDREMAIGLMYDIITVVNDRIELIPNSGTRMVKLKS